MRGHVHITHSKRHTINGEAFLRFAEKKFRVQRVFFFHNMSCLRSGFLAKNQYDISMFYNYTVRKYYEDRNAMKIVR